MGNGYTFIFIADPIRCTALCQIIPSTGYKKIITCGLIYNRNLCLHLKNPSLNCEPSIAAPDASMAPLPGQVQDHVLFCF